MGSNYGFLGYKKSWDGNTRLAYLINIMAVVLTGPYAIYYLVSLESKVAAFTCGGAIVFLCLTLWFYQIERLILAKTMMLSVMIGLVAVYALILFPVESEIRYFFFGIPPAAFSIFNSQKKRQRIIAISLTVVTVVLLVISGFAEFESVVELDKAGIVFMRAIVSFTMTVSISGAFYYYNFENAKNHKKLNLLATTDDLTQIINRRTFFEKGLICFKQAKKEPSSFALLMLDLDFFKNVNDTYGHPAGDKVLVDMTNAVRGHIRKDDMFARYGGEEFVIILKNANKDEAFLIAENLRKLIEETVFTVEKDVVLKMTISIGVTVYKDSFKNFDEMVNTVDKALYIAKENGRNKSVVI